MKTLKITAHTPLKFLGVELFLGWITVPLGPLQGQKKPHFSDRETFILEPGKTVSSLMIAPLFVISMDVQSLPEACPWLRAEERGQIRIDAEALIIKNALPVTIPGFMKIELEIHSDPEALRVIYEYVPMSKMEAQARSYVHSMAALNRHPEIVALREAQEAAGIYGTKEGTAAMREAYARLGEEQK